MVVMTDLSKVIEYRVTAFCHDPKLPYWHQCGHGHGVTARLWLELAGSGADLPETGMLGDPVVLREFETWIESVFSPPHRLLSEIIPDGTTGDLARWVWDQWHERLPELRAVVVNDRHDGTTDWPEHASAIADQIHADHTHQRYVRQVARSYPRISGWDLDWCATVLIRAIEKRGWYAKQDERWGCSAPESVPGPTWQDELAATVTDPAARAAISDRVEAWLTACREISTALRGAGDVDDPAARDRVEAAESRASAIAEAVMDLLDVAGNPHTGSSDTEV